MREREPMTQTMNTIDASKAFPKLVERVSKHEARVVVEENGRPVAALVSAADLEQLRRLDAYHEDPWRVVDEIHARNRDKKTKEIERDVGEALSEARAEHRAQRGRGADQ
jgi:prevent-host-death family protein